MHFVSFTPMYSNKFKYPYNFDSQVNWLIELDPTFEVTTLTLSFYDSKGVNDVNDIVYGVNDSKGTVHR